MTKFITIAFAILFITSCISKKNDDQVIEISPADLGNQDDTAFTIDELENLPLEDFNVSPARLDGYWRRIDLHNNLYVQFQTNGRYLVQEFSVLENGNFSLSNIQGTSAIIQFVSDNGQRNERYVITLVQPTFMTLLKEGATTPATYVKVSGIPNTPNPPGNSVNQCLNHYLNQACTEEYSPSSCASNTFTDPYGIPHTLRHNAANSCFARQSLKMEACIYGLSIAQIDGLSISCQGYSTGQTCREKFNNTICAMNCTYPLTTCSASAFNVTATSCNSCQSRVKVKQALCDKGYTYETIQALPASAITCTP